MKKIATSLLCPLIGVLFMASCLGDGETTELTSTVALLSFEIKDLKAKQTIKKDDGTDSTYTTTVSGSTVEFVIDQNKYLVYNPDSITYGADVRRVLVEVTADGGVYYLKPDGEAGSVEDSIDFTQPVTFRVVSHDGLFSRDYGVSINVHQVDPDKTEWREVVDANFPRGLYVKQKAFVKDDQLFVVGMDANGVYHTSSAALADVSEWETSVCDGMEGASEVVSVVVADDVFYLTTDAGLYRSTDAVNWEVVNSTTSLANLLAVEDGMVWAMSAEGFVVSEDMVTWNAIGQHPKNSIGGSVASFCQPLRTNGDIYRTIFIAAPEFSDTCAQVWTKLSTETDWEEMGVKGVKPYACPNLEQLAVIYYAGNLYAFGGECIGARRELLNAYGEDYKPFGACFESRDNGLTWKPTTKTFSLPEEFEGRTGSFSATTDGEFVWVMWSNGDDDKEYGEVWRGRWNGI